jgi:uncharacterized protein (TIGR04255 family)
MITDTNKVNKMDGALPSRLKKEPLVDVLFELRFSSNASFSDIVPGVFHTQLNGTKEIKRLPHSDLPKSIRDNDPNLQHSPLITVLWENYTIGIGDRILSINCNIPYPGWKQFRSTILDILRIIDGLKIIDSISRCSLKYVDLIEGESIKDQLSKTTLTISLDEKEISEGHTTLRVELPDNDLINIINIVTSARAKFHDNTLRAGVIVDVDTVKIFENHDNESWLQTLNDVINEIHESNKRTFFSCLTKPTVTSLDPVYD